MGAAFSCGRDEALHESLEALLRSIGSDLAKTNLRSVSFNLRDSGSAILKAWGSGKLIVQRSLSLDRREMGPLDSEKKFQVTGPKLLDRNVETTNKSVSFKKTRFGFANDGGSNDIGSPKHEAAVKLQKVYKSFRTRRQLADCAVLVEQRWWKLLDFALLKRSSISFFNIERPESVISKWSRAKSRAAKVGKGLSKDEKAQKLALQHWLEAIDPRHRYGHNLHFYYDCWLRCESRQPFFYWLDVGEGKEVSLEEKCPRSKLQQQCIKYLGPKEREVYEVIVEDGTLLYKKSRDLLNTTEGTKDSKWIFVLSTSRTLYVGQKKKGTFQHSSFLAGGATSAAGRLEVENGALKAVWPHSGHYRPTNENFQEFVSFLKKNNVDLTDVKASPSGEEEEAWTGLRTSRSQEDLSRTNTEEIEQQMADASADQATNAMTHKRSQSCTIFANPGPTSSSYKSTLEGDIGENILHIDNMNSECQATECVSITKVDSTNSEGQYIFRKSNLFVEEQGESEEASVPSELILRRMNFKKGMKSLQLGQQLSFKWTTGAGPRIGCVRDYPSEIQVRSLEQMNLSPRDVATTRVCNSPGNLRSPNPKVQEMNCTNS